MRAVVSSVVNRMLDKSVPVAGRSWYCGRWRTPEQVEKCRSRMRGYLHRRRNAEPEFREKDRERAARYRLARGMKPREVTRREAEEKRHRRSLRTAERRRSRETARAAVSDAEARNRQAPAAVRAAWRDADPNSIIRRKFPTMADLNASARRGEFDAWK
jgi:hypothetical protein